MRRRSRHDARDWAGREANAQQLFDRVAGPERALLDTTIRHLEDELDRLHIAEQTRRVWLDDHPEAEARLDRLAGEVQRIDMQGRLSPKLRHALGAVAEQALRDVPTVERDLDYGAEIGP